jgi:hypothetical protein
MTGDPPKYTFSRDEKVFTIKTDWGKTLQFDLTTGDILKQAKSQLLCRFIRFLLHAPVIKSSNQCS